MPREDQAAPVDDGVDVSLIRWFLSLTPAERLAVLRQYLNSVNRIRELNARG